MTVRLRFIAFFATGIVMAIACLTIFFFTGVVEFSGQSSMSDLFLSIALSVLLLFVLVVSMLTFIRSFDRPIKNLLTAIDKIAAGNLAPDLPDDAPAEFGLIKDALETMCGQMRMILGQLNTLSGHVVETTSGAGSSFQESMFMISSTNDACWCHPGK